MGKICGAVEWVNNPDIGRLHLSNSSSFFCEKSVIGIAGKNRIDDALLGGMICLCDEIKSTLVFDSETRVCVMRENCTCLFRGMNGSFQEQGNRYFNGER